MSARVLALAIGLAALAACRQIGFQDHPVHIDRDEVVTASGVRYSDVFRGKGPVAGPGDEVLLDYTAWTDDDARTSIDSTVDRGVPVVMKIGEAPVEGLNDGLMSMQADGRRVVHVPAKLAYGESGVEGLVPPNTNLVFEVHVIEVRPRKP